MVVGNPGLRMNEWSGSLRRSLTSQGALISVGRKSGDASWHRTWEAVVETMAVVCSGVCAHRSAVVLGVAGLFRDSAPLCPASAPFAHLLRSLFCPV